MPFAQGIDSDIEEVTTVQANPTPSHSLSPPLIEIAPPSSPPPLESPVHDDIDVDINFEPYQKPYETPYSEPDYLEQFRDPYRESFRDPYMQEPHVEPYPEELEKVQEPKFEDYAIGISPDISPEDLQEKPVDVEESREVPIKYSSSELLEIQKEFDKEESEKIQIEEEIESEKPESLIEKEEPIEIREENDENIITEEKEEEKEQDEKVALTGVTIVGVIEKLPEEVMEEPLDNVADIPTSPKVVKQKSLETPRQLSSETSTEAAVEFQCQADDDADTSATITVIPTKVKTPSSSSSSLSSSHDELITDDITPSIQRVAQKQPSQEQPPTPPPPLPLTPPAHIRSLNDMQTKNFDSDSIDSINAIDCKIDDDNRESSASDSLQRTPPPLPQLSLEKR
jgi:hypothetical protein